METPLEQLCRLDSPKLLAKFKDVSQTLGVGVLRSLGRHSGASINKALNHRTMPEVQKRGRSLVLASARRCEKVGRFNDALEGLTPALQAYFTACDRGLEQALVYGKFPDAPSNLQRCRRCAPTLWHGSRFPARLSAMASMGIAVSALGENIFSWMAEVIQDVRNVILVP